MKLKKVIKKKVYMIVNRHLGGICGAYSRAYHDVYEFNSPGEARNSNVHGIYKDKKEFDIAEYEVTYKLLNPNKDRKKK